MGLGSDSGDEKGTAKKNQLSVDVDQEQNLPMTEQIGNKKNKLLSSSNNNDTESDKS